MNADGSEQTQLTFEAEKSYSPQWSPDGSKIAFISTREGDRYHVFVMDADGSDVIRVTRLESDHLDYSWSPTGAYIVYATYFFPDFDLDLYRVTVDGLSTDKLTDMAGHETYPSWR